MNIHRIARGLKGQIAYFSGKLSGKLPKVVGRFICEMIFGICAKGSVRLSEIARALDEPIPLIKTIDRLSENLSREGLRVPIVSEIIREGTGRIKADTLLIIDPSDITKPYAEKMEYLARVRDGSTGEIADGYWTCNVIAVEAGEPDIVPLYMELYSQEAPDFVSENREIINAVDAIRSHTGNLGVWVMDRGGDREKLLKPFLDRSMRFIVRLKGDRHLIHRGKAVEALTLAQSCNLPYSEHVVREHEGKEVICRIEYGFRKVKLPGVSDQLYMVVVKGFGQDPMMLLTNVQMRNKRSVLWWAVEAYLTRWRIEETIRFIKQSYRLEDVRVLTYERLRNMIALVLAASFFAAVNLGLKAKLQILAGHALAAAKRIFGIPDFRFYALADGIKDILSRAGKGLPAPNIILQPNPQRELFPS